MSEKTIEELLNELEKSEPTKVVEVKKRTRESDIFKFLTKFNVEPGVNLIERKILYNLYKKYSESPVKEKKFYSQLKNYLKASKSYFHINQKSLDLSERVLNMLTPPSKRSTTKMIPLQMHFNNFLKKYDIKPGKKPNHIWVSAKTLYDLYDEWSYGIRKKRPLNYKQFISLCKVYFPIAKTGVYEKVWISLDDSIKTIIEARNSYKNEKEEKPKE